MDNITFLVKGCQSGAYKKKEWVISSMCRTRLPSERDPNKHYPYKLYQKDGYPCIWLGDITDEKTDDFEFITLNGKMIVDEPILYPDETMELRKGDIPNFKGDKLTTTPGKYIFNWYCLVEPLNDKVDYINDDGVDVGKFVKKLAPVVEDTPDDILTIKPDIIYVHQYKRMLDNISAFSGFTGINAPSATEYTMTGAPGIQELRDKLLEKNKDKLHDPVVVSDIEEELIKYDKEYLSKDPYAGFYIGAKSVRVVRKKLHSMQGIQTRMDSSKPAHLITKSLSEPTDVKDLPAIVDGIRSGSYFRGVMTALGGEGVKYIYRMFSAATISMDDCKAKVGIRRVIRPDLTDYYTGIFILDKGKSILLTKDNIGQYVGKEVMMRSPAYCRADPSGRTVCLSCMGIMFKGRGTSIAAAAGQVASTMNGRFMGAMHSVTNDAIPIVFSEAIS